MNLREQVEAAIATKRAALAAEKEEATRKEIEECRRRLELPRSLPRIQKHLEKAGNIYASLLSEALFVNPAGECTAPPEILALLQEAATLGLCPHIPTHKNPGVHSLTDIKPFFGLTVKLEPDQWFVDQPPAEKHLHLLSAGETVNPHEETGDVEIRGPVTRPNSGADPRKEPDNA